MMQSKSVRMISAGTLAVLSTLGLSARAEVGALNSFQDFQDTSHNDLTNCGIVPGSWIEGADPMNQQQLKTVSLADIPEAAAALEDSLTQLADNASAAPAAQGQAPKAAPAPEGAKPATPAPATSAAKPAAPAATPAGSPPPTAAGAPVTAKPGEKRTPMFNIEALRKAIAEKKTIDGANVPGRPINSSTAGKAKLNNAQNRISVPTKEQIERAVKAAQEGKVVGAKVKPDGTLETPAAKPTAPQAVKPAAAPAAPQGEKPAAAPAAEKAPTTPNPAAPAPEAKK